MAVRVRPFTSLRLPLLLLIRPLYPPSFLSVAVRVRPFTSLETDARARRIVSYKDNKIIIVNPQAFDADPDAIANAAASVQCKEWAQVGTHP